MIDKETVFVLGAGASCPYGYPSGALLRKSICLPQKFSSRYSKYESRINESVQNTNRISAKEINEFRIKFEKSSIKSIDLFMANNPKLAMVGKYIIAFEIFSAEKESKFREEAKLWQELSRNSPPRTWTSTDRILRKDDYQGEDWYSYLYNRLIEGLIGKAALLNLSYDKIAFITFNYDRSLEHFLYESLRYSFTELEEKQILECINKFKIIHVYGKIASLKWEDPEKGVDYRQEIDEPLLQKTSDNIKTIYEQRTSAEIEKASSLLAQAKRVFFLGFGYAPENMEVLNLPDIISNATLVCGTAFEWENREIERVKNIFIQGFQRVANKWISPDVIKIENMDCLKLLRNYL